MVTATIDARGTEGEIFARVWDENGGLTPGLARQVLKLGFGSEDKARMKYLSARNRAGLISPEEQSELDGFVKVGDLLAILQAKARRIVSPSSRTRHG